MTFSPQSQAVVDQLLAGKKVSSARAALGPLDEAGRTLLRVVSEKHAKLQARNGTEQLEFLCERYKEAKKISAEESVTKEEPCLPPEAVANNETLAVAKSQKPTSKNAYVLKRLESTSFRGLAPAGQSVTFDFDGKSNLIYGPNGSGKTSLLGAVIWVMTGQAISDAQDKNETAPVHTAPNSDGKRKKLADWAVVATLPDGGITKNTRQECSAQIELASSDGKSTLHLKRCHNSRCHNSELTARINDDAWKPCADLTQFGIETLDLQLSLVAPATFARFTLENAPNTTSLLSLMLGYDDLENIGAMASTMSGNRTRRANTERKTIDADWRGLNQQLSQLPERLPEKHEARETLQDLATSQKASNDLIKKTGKKISAFIAQAENDLAKLIGLDSADSKAHSGLADNLTGAVLALERGVWDNFPLLDQLRITTAIPPSEENSSDDLLQEMAQKLKEFIPRAKERISNRLEWWRSENSPESKDTLLLQAAQSYEPEKEICPVCEQTITDSTLKEKLSELKHFDKELQEELTNFFRNLSSELDKFIPRGIRDLAKQTPQERMLTDWGNLTGQTLFADFSPLTSKYEKQVQEIASKLTFNAPEQPALFPSKVENDFAQSGLAFESAVEQAVKAIAILCWSQVSMEKTGQTIQAVVTAPRQGATASLYGVLAIGKTAAAAVKPLKALRDELRSAYKERETIAVKEVELALLEELQSPLDQLKELRKYAEGEVQLIFADIAKSTFLNWGKMYPESASGLEPARLVVGKTRVKSITPFLSKGAYEVPGQFFNNAGLQRAIALAFFFALLEKHPRGLGFAIMDDPIHSLDDGHWERWSREILKPCMTTFQFIVAIHQEHHFSNSKEHFIDGNVIELNDRPKSRRISRRPGNRLAQVKADLDKAPKTVPNQMRMYCEELLATLETYSHQPFANEKLSNSIAAYNALPSTDPLATPRRKEIVDFLRDAMVVTVANAGSHHPTQANVTKAMSQDCHAVLIKCDRVFQKELARLNKKYRHSRRQALIPTTVIAFAGLPPLATWAQPIELEEFGRAAAKGESWVVDSLDEASATSIATGAAVLVTSDALDPVARRGQWALLADADVSCKDGDLVAVTCASGDHLLRRIWSSGDDWAFQSINSVRPIPIQIAPKIESAPRKVVGILYTPEQSVTAASHANTIEWKPHGGFQSKCLANLATVYVEGGSLDPIARAGQRVLISKEPVNDYREVNNGDLAVVDSNVPSIGCVIKRVYLRKGHCILVSPNPVDPHPPELLTETQLRSSKFWIVRGVLFESTD